MVAQDAARQAIGQIQARLTGAEPGQLSLAGGEAGQGWFTSSNMDIGYKVSRVVAGYTDTYYNPHTTTTFTPRWNFTFPSKLSASINAGFTSDVAVEAGTINEAKRLTIGLQLRHEFRAERLLAKLHLYKPGSTPSLVMDVTADYGHDSNTRTTPGSDLQPIMTGQTRMSISPRFSYQITRNLSGGLQFNYSRNKTLEDGTVSQTFGLGLEATFVF